MTYAEITAKAAAAKKAAADAAARDEGRICACEAAHLPTCTAK